MKCKICGRVYRRKECEFCMRARKWENVYIEFRKKTFTPRLIRDLELYTSPDDIPSLPNTGKGLYIHGPIGAGKTLLAARILEKEKRECFIENKPFSMQFVSVPMLLSQLRGTFSANKNTPSEMELICQYSDVDCLVLDDLGGEKSSEWVLQSLYIIINNRYEYLKPTIFTSNLGLDQLAEKLGDDRIPSRIYAMAELHRLKDGDKRLIQ